MSAQPTMDVTVHLDEDVQAIFDECKTRLDEMSPVVSASVEYFKSRMFLAEGLPYDNTGLFEQWAAAVLTYMTTSRGEQ